MCNDRRLGETPVLRYLGFVAPCAEGPVGRPTVGPESVMLAPRTRRRTVGARTSWEGRGRRTSAVSPSGVASPADRRLSPGRVPSHGGLRPVTGHSRAARPGQPGRTLEGQGRRGSLAVAGGGAQDRAPDTCT